MDVKHDRRLIEQGFPCHQVGAETTRERDTGKAPPTHRLHVWWARRPLTPSRAAIVASLDPAGTDVETFIRQLGIEKKQVEINGVAWTLTGDLLERVERDAEGGEWLTIDRKVLTRLEKEQERRSNNRALLTKLVRDDLQIETSLVYKRWKPENDPIPNPLPNIGKKLAVSRVMADPAWANERIEWENSLRIRTNENKYGYERAYKTITPLTNSPRIILDPTAGGGSIPFEAMRLGHKVIANELNPVATTILYATLDYPARFGLDLIEDIEKWGQSLLAHLRSEIGDLFASGTIPSEEAARLLEYLKYVPEFVKNFMTEKPDGFLYVRQVTCPICGGEAPLLNSSWLSKEADDPWGVRVVIDGAPRHGKVRFEPYRLLKGKGPKGEDPEFATVNNGTGLCVHCKQAIDDEEIKRQARGESEHGRWQDRLYCVVAVRLQPKLDKQGKPQRYASGERAGEIKTEKVRFFRAPNERDLQALAETEARLKAKWDEWDAQGLIPTEAIPKGSKTSEPLRYGMEHWCDLFTPRQLLGHLTLAAELNRLKPQILAELGEERGRAVVTYLQFAIDKGVDYNSRQTRWHFSRGVLIGTFGRHDFSLKWTFGEMVFSGPASGAAWGLSQVVDAYQGIAELLAPVHERYKRTGELPIQILNGSGAHMGDVADCSVDLVCMDPPYYDNVQYAELSDFYYVWQRRTLADLYPGVFSRRLTNKQDEAVANPARDGSRQAAKTAYERMMGGIFSECRRVLKDDGLLTMMFTHKSQDAWETLTRSLIEVGWEISSSLPVDSEAASSIHQKDLAAAASSIFIACRKRVEENALPALWTGLGGSGVQSHIREAVKAGLKEFAPLKLNPVDEMVASYGRALQVLSEQWPVMDGDEPVSPIRAMNEASAVVAASQIDRITKGRLHVDELDPETAMALTLFGIFGTTELPYDEALNLSRSLNIRLEAKAHGYSVEGRMIGINAAAGSGQRSRSARAENHGYHAPLVRKAAKLRLALPEERDPRRLAKPQTDWDVLQGLIQAYRKGDVPVARAYLDDHADGAAARLLDLLAVWAAEIGDPELRREAEMLQFGLGGRMAA